MTPHSVYFKRKIKCKSDNSHPIYKILISTSGEWGGRYCWLLNFYTKDITDFLYAVWRCWTRIWRWRKNSSKRRQERREEEYENGAVSTCTSIVFFCNPILP